MLHGSIMLAYFFFLLWVFFIWWRVCCIVSLNNLILSKSALLVLATDFNEFYHFYVISLFKTKHLAWYSVFVVLLRTWVTFIFLSLAWTVLTFVLSKPGIIVFYQLDFSRKFPRYIDCPYTSLNSSIPSSSSLIFRSLPFVTKWF